MTALTAIPEIAASGFGVARNAHGICLARRRSPRGHWRGVADGYAWIPVNSEDIARTVPTLEEAVRETLLIILISLQVKRKHPADVMKTAEAILPNPALRIASR